MAEDAHASTGVPDDPVAARIGTVLAGKWTLERLLGSGAMAAVYVGRHKIGRRDAIKILHPDVARNEQLAARFEQEAHAVNCLDHPGAVEIRDIGTTEEGEPYLVMELLEGRSLTERMAEGPLDPPQVLELADQVLDVLKAAHAAEIIHRDIKPDNLFLLDDGRLKVLDFGIARVRRAGSMKVVTQMGTALGTPSYMPQEQIKGLDVDHRADLFAVGAVMFELLAGRCVHEGETEQIVMVAMLTRPAPPLSSVAPGLPAGLCQVVDRALAFEACDRYPDAETMQTDLRAARDGLPPPFASQSAHTAHGAREHALTADGAGVAAGVAAAVEQTAAAGPASGQAPPDAATTLQQAPADHSVGAQTLRSGAPAEPEPPEPSRGQPTTRPLPTHALGKLAIVAASGLIVGIVIVLLATGSDESVSDAPSLQGPLPGFGGGGPTAEPGTETSMVVAPSPIETTQPRPQPVGPTKKQPEQEPERQRKQEERERKKREKDKERERKKREKDQGHGRKKGGKNRKR